jgi:anaerobic selenocysteine-containing dehydrogenase
MEERVVGERTDASGGDWKPNACSLCYLNCGVQVQTQGRTIVKVRGDKAHPHSAGYTCQKAHRLPFYGSNADRLTTPLRRRPDGTHEPIDWDTALDEIAERLWDIREADLAAGRPGSLLSYGGGGQGNHSGGPYLRSLLSWMGSTRHFNALAQEKTGDFWVNGKMFGAQNVHTSEGVEECDLLLVIGANPWLAHGFRNARRVVNEIKTDQGRRMIVIDPRRTETAEVADLHLALRPGTDAFLLSAMLAMILRRDGQAADWLAAHTEGFGAVAAVLDRVPIVEWVAHAEVDMADVERAVEMILAAKEMTVRAELGIQQGRHSTLNSYLEKLLFLLTGNFGRPGTNGVHSWLQPLWGRSNGERSQITGYEYIGGLLPPNTIAEEILSEHPHRARAMFVQSGNPANTVADTAGFEAAIRACELSVVIDVAYTETAALADYVLPAASQHEKWEYTFFNFEWPTNYFHLRRPLFEPLPGTLPESEIYARLFDRLGVLPEQAVLDKLTQIARDDRPRFLEAAREVMADHPGLAQITPVLLNRTLGQLLPDGAAHIAPIWMSCHTAAGTIPTAVQRALETDAEGFALGEVLFERALSSPSGFAFSKHEYDEIWQLVQRDRIQLAVPEMLDWLARLDPAAERPDPEYPFSLVNGQRRSHNANQILRSPAWRRSDPDGAMRIHPDDLATLGVDPDGWIAVISPTGRIVVRAEANDSMRRKQIALPHGFGMSVPLHTRPPHWPELSGGCSPDRTPWAGGSVVDGPRINMLTAATDRDPIAGTPHHKDLPVRLEAATAEESAAADEARARVREILGGPTAA